MIDRCRRKLLGLAAASILLRGKAVAASQNTVWDEAVGVLEQAVASGAVRAASLYVRGGDRELMRSFGDARSNDASFLLGSISKPIAIAALMTLYDQGWFDLDQPAQKYLPEFRDSWRAEVTVKQLLTHTSGLPDQLPENAKLRSEHAPLSRFVEGALRVPLGFRPGSQYRYSSMAILLAAEIAQRLSGTDIKQLVQQNVLEPLEMNDSALGLGQLRPDQTVPCQVEFGAVESGGGSADSKAWDWNSEFWRNLGAPWGGQHASARDVGKFLQEFLRPSGRLFRPEVAQLMTRNHNPPGVESRGLGFDVGMQSDVPGGSPATFGHTGSTGTIAWADPQRDLICVVLTSLPSDALPAGEHPRHVVSERVSTSYRAD
jgi:CubicO group peptidase (beta-lactamase class C family)